MKEGKREGRKEDRQTERQEKIGLITNKQTNWHE